jgi:hypothetical protein
VKVGSEKRVGFDASGDGGGAGEGGGAGGVGGGGGVGERTTTPRKRSRTRHKKSSRTQEGGGAAGGEGAQQQPLRENQQLLEWIHAGAAGERLGEGKFGQVSALRVGGRVNAVAPTLRRPPSRRRATDRQPLTANR